MSYEPKAMEQRVWKELSGSWQPDSAPVPRNICDLIQSSQCPEEGFQMKRQRFREVD